MRVERTAVWRRILIMSVLAVVATSVLVVLVLRATHDRVSDDAGLSPDPTAAECHLVRCRGTAGESGSPISRAQVAQRAHRWLGHHRIRYSSSAGHVGPGGWGWYRRDCSGFVSMALHLPDDGGGATTVDLLDDVVAVPSRDLRPYDLIGRLGPGSGGEFGHVQFFLGWVGRHHDRVRVAEQGGLSAQARWPHVTTYRWPERMADGTVLSTYRYVRIAPDP